MFYIDPRSNVSAIVGVWSGRDDEGLATVAPMVLSHALLEIPVVRSIVDKVSFRWLLNAEDEGEYGVGGAASSPGVP